MTAARHVPLPSHQTVVPWRPRSSKLERPPAQSTPLAQAYPRDATQAERGAAGEQLGYDRHLKTNTTKRRTHSLFRQGSMLYELMPNMTDFRLLPLIERFAQLLAAQPLFAQMFGVI